MGHKSPAKILRDVKRITAFIRKKKTVPVLNKPQQLICQQLLLAPLEIPILSSILPHVPETPTSSQEVPEYKHVTIQDIMDCMEECNAERKRE